MVPRQPSAPCVLARPADGERLGLRRPHSTRARSPCTSAGCARRSRTIRPQPRHLETVWGVGYRLAAVIANASSSPLATLGVGLALALALRALPTVRLQLAGLAVLAVLPAAGRRAAVGLGDVPHGRRREDPRRHGGVGARRPSSPRSGWARSIVDSIDGVRDASVELAHGDLDGARARGRAARRSPTLAASFNEMASKPRTPLRRTARARGMGEPRPAHAARQHAGDARGARGRSRRRPAEYAAGRSREQVRAPVLLVDDLFELARIDAGALDLELQEAADRSGRVRAACAAWRRRLGCAARHAGRRGRRMPSPRALRPNKVERVLMNLLTNALHHTPYRRRGRRASSSRGEARCGSRSRTRVKVSTKKHGSVCSSASGGATVALVARRRPRARNRARARRGARGTHLGGGSRGRRRPCLLHAARGLIGPLKVEGNVDD